MVDKSTSKKKLTTNFQDIFSLFDKNGNGKIVANDIEVVMRSLNLNPSEGEPQAIIDEVDIDKNGEIDFDEFKAMMTNKKRKLSPDEELRIVFDVFDKNGDGFISFDELKQVMIQIEPDITDKELAEMMVEADKDDNFLISFEEFEAMNIFEK